MAQRILERVAETLGRELPGVERSAEVPLPGAPSEPISTYRLELRETLSGRGIAPDTVERLQFLYGTELEELLAYGEEEPGWLAPLSPSLPALRGEVRLAVETGMALHLADVLDRRMALLLFSGDGGVSGMVEAASIMGSLLGWSEERRKAEMEGYLVTVRGHRPFVDTVPPLG
jgi:glycerol-3-phosphate dehydrogenase